MFRAATFFLTVSIVVTSPAVNGAELLDKYVGAYPCAGKDQFFSEPAVAGALKQALGSAAERYNKHRSISGCGAIARYDKYLFVDISQLHVGGYTSMILLDPPRSRRTCSGWKVTY